MNAGLEMPDCSRYGDFPQLENGVGMWALLKNEFDSAIKEIPDGLELSAPRSITMATGAAAHKLMRYIADTVESRVKNIRIKVVKIDNRLFGEKITVAGLLCGNDIYKGLEDIQLGDELLIPEVSLRSEGDLFLDDVGLEELAQRLKIKVTPVPNDGYVLLERILDKKEW